VWVGLLKYTRTLPVEAALVVTYLQFPIQVCCQCRASPSTTPPFIASPCSDHALRATLDCSASPVHSHFDHAHFRHSSTLVMLIIVLIITYVHTQGRWVGLRGGMVTPRTDLEGGGSLACPISSLLESLCLLYCVG